MVRRKEERIPMEGKGKGKGIERGEERRGEVR